MNCSTDPSASPPRALWRICLAIALAAGGCGRAVAEANVAADPLNDQAVALLRSAQRAPSPAAAQDLRRQALQLLDQILGGDVHAAQQRRACFDRVVALSQLNRHQQALADYREQCQPLGPAPAYVLSALGDSHAGLGQPEQALQAYEQALQSADADEAPHAGRIFALADLDRMEQAERILRDRLDAGASPAPRDDQLRLALVRAWGGWVDQSAAQVTTLADAAPADAELARQQGGLELLRDRPYHALEDYDRALANAPGYLGAALDRVSALDRLGRRREAAAVLDSLHAEAADWPPLQRLQQNRRRDAGTSLEFRQRAARGGDRQIASGESRSEWLLSSPVFAHDWRAYAAYRRAYADFRGAYLEDQRVAAGLRWFRNGLRLQLEVDDPMDRLVDGNGYALAADWRHSDDWSFAAATAHNAFDLPLRARGAGTTGNRHELAARYSPRGQFWLRLAGNRIDYSDGNRHEELNLSGFQRLPLNHQLALTVAPALGIGRNRLDSVPYFSPPRDVTGELAVALEQRIYARLAHRHHQRLELFLGAYDQQHYSAQPIGGLRYDYRIEFRPGRSAFLRLGRDRRAYDGAAEYQTFAEVGATWAW